MAIWVMVSFFLSGVIKLTRSGNLHINIVANKYSEEVEKVIEPYVYEIVGTYSFAVLADRR